MKPEQTIHIFLSSLLAWIGAKFQAFGMLVISLALLMIIDYITGMLASRKEGIEHPGDTSYGWSSRKGFLGILRKTGCWLIIGSSFSIDALLHHSASSLGINYPSHFFLGVFVIIWYSLNEVLSIIENAGRIGVPIPQKLKNYISILKKELNDKDSLP